MGGPTGFEVDGGAGGGAEEGGGEVLDLVAVFREDRKAAVGPVPFALGAEFGVGGAGDGDDLGVAHQGEGHVEDVDAEVDQGTAAGLLFVGEPGAKTGDPGVAHPEGFGVVDVAESAGLDVLAEEFRFRLVAFAEADAEDLAGGIRGADDLLALGGVAGEGFLHQDVFAGGEGGEGDGEMEVVGDADADGVDVGALDEIAVVVDDVEDVVLAGDPQAALGVQPGQGDDVGPRFLRPGLGVDHADPAPDDPNPKRIHTERCSFFSLAGRHALPPAAGGGGHEPGVRTGTVSHTGITFSHEMGTREGCAGYAGSRG